MRIWCFFVEGEKGERDKKTQREEEEERDFTGRGEKEKEIPSGCVLGATRVRACVWSPIVTPPGLTPSFVFLRRLR